MSQNFTFQQGDDSFEFEKSLNDVITPAWLRANRRRDEMDLILTIIEDCAGDDALAAFYRLTKAEFRTLSDNLNKALGASLGE